jgi:GT2 family glycosyltransferase
MSNLSVSILITNFNGKELLKKYLPSIVEACKRYSLDKTELIILDNASSDGTVDYLKFNFPFIRLIEQPVNRGFSDSVNLGVSFAKNKIVASLNNDIQVSEDFFLFLPQHFEDKDIFALRPGVKRNPQDGIRDLDNPGIGGGFRLGFFDVPKKVKEKTNLAFFAGGGGIVFDKEKFMALGGFDSIFQPFYYEDVDLSYRAWKRGWKIIYEPRSLLYHQGGATVLRFYSPFFIEKIAERNRHLLVWKAITDKGLLFQHFIFIPIRLVSNLLRGKFASVAGFFCALLYLKEAVKKRKLEKQFMKVSDKEIFSYFKG